MISKPKYLLLLTLTLIAMLFLGAASLTYRQFSSDFIKNESASQKKLIGIVNQSLNRYFETLKFVTENAVLHSAFDPEVTREEDNLRFEIMPKTQIKKIMTRFRIERLLANAVRIAARGVEPLADLPSWKIYKGLPEIGASSEFVAKERRVISKNILKAFKDIHYAFEMDATGDLIFLEPFEIQKNVSSFNYEFRDYLRLAKSTKATAISEGYISHDQNRTQVITIASPIMDKTGKVAKIFAVSVSATTLRERVFRSLKENMDLSDGTTFYLVDRHGHIVASSSGKNIYFPTEGKREDENDLGNLRSTGFFRDISWTSDILEKGNIWERDTKSWVTESLNKEYSGKYRNINNIEVFGTLFPTPIIGSESTNWGILIETPLSQLLASKKSLSHLFYVSGSILITILMLLFAVTVRNFNRLETQIYGKQVELEQIASQVAHDIRSPLAALNMIVGHLSELPEDKRIMIRSAVGRIRDIANNLLTKSRETQGLSDAKDFGEREELGTYLISSMLDEIITEKRLQFRSRIGIEIEARLEGMSYGLFAKVQPTEFKRVISNLLNNSIEALNQTGKIEIFCESIDNVISIFINDNGRGIPATVLPKLAEKGFTFGKGNGNGLGLYHARKSIQSFGGSLSVSSTLNEGTSVRITLPKIPAPRWFVPSLELSKDLKIAVLDDDSSIHQLWSGRLDSQHIKEMNIDVAHFSTLSAFSFWVKNSDFKNILYLVDYELVGEPLNGLAIIEQLGIQLKSILVTSRYEEPLIRQNCDRLSVPIIPKGMAGFIPFNKINSEGSLFFS